MLLVRQNIIRETVPTRVETVKYESDWMTGSGNNQKSR